MLLCGQASTIARLVFQVEHRPGKTLFLGQCHEIVCFEDTSIQRGDYMGVPKFFCILLHLTYALYNS